MDSGVIRHFKQLLRKHLAKLHSGRRQVLHVDNEEMYGICCEVWDAIPVEDLRQYMMKCEKTKAVGRLQLSRLTLTRWETTRRPFPRL
jgi:hypothetical protein